MDQFSSATQSCPTVCDHVNHSTPGLLAITNSWNLPTPMSIVLEMPSNHLILCCPILLLPSIFPASESFQMSQLFASGDQSIGVSASTTRPSMNTQDWSLISFREFDWLNLLAVQGTLKSLLQHHSSKASILLYSAFFIVQLWHPYMTTGKTIALTRRSFVGRVMSLLLNISFQGVSVF